MFSCTQNGKVLSKREGGEEIEVSSPAWLTPDLKQKVRDLFEPKYQRALSDDEICLIAENLTGFMEAILKFKSQIEIQTKK